MLSRARRAFPIPKSLADHGATIDIKATAPTARSHELHETMSASDENLEFIQLES